MRAVTFVASARDYHAMDWYRIIKKLLPQVRVSVATDLIEGEGFERIVDASDEVTLLFPMDRFLTSDQSRLGNIWRNIVKLLALPVMAIRLKFFVRRARSPILHAHSMYYIFLCWIARVSFIATPMGSDVLVRPDRSRVYRYFTIKALRSASAITVDSIALQEKIHQLAGVPSRIIQNGIDAAMTKPYRETRGTRHRVMSIRGCDSNYRIVELVRARNRSQRQPDLDLIYPFYELEYKQTVKSELRTSDQDHGRVSKPLMYQLLGESILVISVPISDSSPRSVYEAIFCGCCVAVTYGKWVDALPICMRERIFVVDLSSENWMDSAIDFAYGLQSAPYVPSKEALQDYDEIEAMKVVCRTLYGATV